MHKCYFCKHLILIILICVCKSFLLTGVIVHFSCFCFTWMSLSSICKSPFFQQIYNVCIVVCVSWFLCECLWMHVCNMSFLLVPKSLWTLPLPIMANQGKLVVSWKQMQCHWCLFVFFAPATWSLRAAVSSGMSVDYEAEKGTALKESVQLTSVGQMMKPLSIEPIESWRNTRGCSASEVKCVKDPPIERPTRGAGHHAVCIQTGLQKNKAILVGLRSCRWEVWAKQAREEEKRNRNKVKRGTKIKTKKDSRGRCRWR